jgi:CO/xanthine dehydrogenase FAD-binding subunit
VKTSTAPVHTATDLAEALAFRRAHPEATVLAGGTDVMVFMEAGSLSPESVLNIWGCTGLRGITEDESTGAVRIGALTTWTDIIQHAAIPEALHECARTVGAVQIQNRGTVGGNIVNASPAGDSLPLWLALDAEFEVANIDGGRRIAAADFWTGYRTTMLAPDELLIAVHICPDHSDHLHYRKVGTRLAQAISKVVLGGRLRLVDGVVVQARVALGSVAPVPMRLARVEAALLGKPVDPQAAALVAQDITPIDDIRSTSDYRTKVACRIVQSWLERCR